MKKILFIVFAFALCLDVSFGQSTASASTMTTVGSPVINTATVTSTLKVTDTYKQVTVQAIITKVSGTIAGTLTLQGSLDGVNYFTIPTAATVAGAATYTATDVATQSATFIVNGSSALFFRVSYTGTGTMNATVVSYLLARK